MLPGMLLMDILNPRRPSLNGANVKMVVLRTQSVESAKHVVECDKVASVDFTPHL